jgi:hypothetical protein
MMNLPQTPQEIEAAIVELKRQGLIPTANIDAKLQLLEPEVQSAAARWIRAKAMSTELDLICRIIGAAFAIIVGFGIAGFVLISILAHAR